MHETLVHRLAQMLIKLNSGESLRPEVLASEFGVTLRTIQRDLNERFSYLPLVKENGGYRMDQACLGRFSTRDIERFARLSGVRGLFPALTPDFIGEIFDVGLQSTWRVEGYHYENLSHSEALFTSLERAIAGHNRISFDYRKVKSVKSYRDVEPYQLINVKGIWYLVASDGGALKTFAFTRIRQLTVLMNSFVPDPHIMAMARQPEGVWWTANATTARIHVSWDVAEYFKRRPLIAGQTIECEGADGSLILRVAYGHSNQILPIVRYWMPHLTILEPPSLREELSDILDVYVARLSSVKP